MAMAHQLRLGMLIPNHDYGGSFTGVPSISCSVTFRKAFKNILKLVVIPLSTGWPSPVFETTSKMVKVDMVIMLKLVKTNQLSECQATRVPIL